MKHSDVSRALAEHGFMASPEAVDEISRAYDAAGCISRLAATLDPSKTMVITPTQVRDALTPPAGEPDSSGGEIDVSGDDTASTGGVDDNTPLTVETKPVTVPPGDGSPPHFEILCDYEGEVASEGTYADFERHFLDRFNRTSRMFRGRISSIPVDVASRPDSDGNSVYVVGMVTTAKETKNGHLLVELEDTTGTLKVLVAKDSPLRHEVHLLTEDVVAVLGKMSRKGLFIAEAVDFPDVELTGPPPAAPTDACVAFTSDLHVGSREFMAEDFERFIDVLAGREQLPGEDGMMERVRYLLVAGDIVDGIGVYPEQYEDLVIEDIAEQYRAASEYFKRVPPDIAVFICPGNHDAVRQAVPQPALPQRFREGFNENVHFVDNPATLLLGGHRVVMCHGRFIEDMSQNIPGTTWTDPQNAMRELLRRRHLQPVYGGRVPIAPEAVDRFVLSDVPHVLHTGHTHTFGAGEYRGVKLVNAGCWQSQTDFQRRMDIQPEPGKVPVMDLSTGGVSVYDFIG